MFKPGILETLYSKKRMHLGNTSIYRSQYGVIRDSPITPTKNLLKASDTDTKATYGAACFALPKN